MEPSLHEAANFATALAMAIALGIKNGSLERHFISLAAIVALRARAPTAQQIRQLGQFNVKHLIDLLSISV